MTVDLDAERYRAVKVKAARFDPRWAAGLDIAAERFRDGSNQAE